MLCYHWQAISLKHLYIGCSLKGQQLLLKRVFEVGVMYNGRLVRTPSLKEKGLLIVEQPDDFLRKSWSCTVSGNWFEPLGRFIETLLFVNRFKLDVLLH